MIFLNSELSENNIAEHQQDKMEWNKWQSEECAKHRTFHLNFPVVCFVVFVNENRLCHAAKSIDFLD